MKDFTKKELLEALDANMKTVEIASLFECKPCKIYNDMKKWGITPPRGGYKRKKKEKAAVSAQEPAPMPTPSPIKLPITPEMLEDYMEQGVSLMKIVQTHAITMDQALQWASDIKGGLLPVIKPAKVAPEPVKKPETEENSKRAIRLIKQDIEALSQHIDNNAGQDILFRINAMLSLI